eukprot:9483608-Pyramimonas_sp.AAC.1
MSILWPSARSHDGAVVQAEAAAEQQRARRVDEPVAVHELCAVLPSPCAPPVARDQVWPQRAPERCQPTPQSVAQLPAIAYVAAEPLEECHGPQVLAWQKRR